MAWNALQAGDKVDLVAPSHSMSEDELNASIAYVKSLGLEPVVPDDLLGDDLFCSNSDAYRGKHLYHALSNTETKAVWALRGGYGATRLIPYLKTQAKVDAQKLFLGFSDITALHIFLTQEWGWQTVHGSVITPITKGVVDSETLELNTQVMFGNTKEVAFDLEPLNAAAKEEGEALTSMAGGNISIVQTSLGTEWQMQAKGKLVVLEEIDERAYRVERILTHMAQAGVFDEAAGVVFGTFGNEHTDAQTTKLFEQTMQKFANDANEYALPCFKTDKIGHTLVNNPVPMNTQAVLRTGKDARVTIQTGVN